MKPLPGIPVEYRDEGTIVVALTRDDLDQLRFTYEFQRGLGLDLEWLSAAEARRLEPHLRPGLSGAVLSRRDHQVENRRVGRALAVAVRRAGAALHERCPVREIEITGGRAAGVVTDRGREPADAWFCPPVPGRGKLAGFPGLVFRRSARSKDKCWPCRWTRQRRCLRHVIWLPRGYLVPRRDGRLLIGATVEERGFDAALTAGGLLTLIEGAWRAVPAIEELPIAETWVGFRPGSRDDAPLLGPSGIDRLIIATGHHRNGILLAPLTAAAIGGYILSGRVPEILRSFAPDRFAAASAATAPGYRAAPAMMRLQVNGLEAEVSATTVAELLAAQGIDPATRFLAVAVNGAVVRRAEWASRRLAAGDDVEIVRPLSGG